MVEKSTIIVGKINVGADCGFKSSNLNLYIPMR
jgi:hypothetical protein